jgi:hypothetical protein
VNEYEVGGLKDLQEFEVEERRRRGEPLEAP